MKCSAMLQTVQLLGSCLILLIVVPIFPNAQSDHYTIGVLKEMSLEISGLRIAIVRRVGAKHADKKA